MALRDVQPGRTRSGCGPLLTESVMNARKVPRLALALGLLLTVAAAVLLAHEGHAPLPSRGARVDVPAGHVTLSAEARGALDVRAEGVTAAPVPGHLLAYVTLVAPWQRHAFVSSRLAGRITRL